MFRRGWGGRAALIEISGCACLLSDFGLGRAGLVLVI